MSIGQNDPGLVTLELSTIIVRLHKEKTRWGDMDDFDSSFILVQIAPGIMEIKGASFLELMAGRRRELEDRLEVLGIKQVIYCRYKKGIAPYKIIVHIGQGKTTRERL